MEISGIVPGKEDEYKYGSSSQEGRTLLQYVSICHVDDRGTMMGAKQYFSIY